VSGGLDLSACASENRKQLTLFAVNSKAEPVTLTIRLTDLSADMRPISGEVVCDTLDMRQIDVMNHWTAPERVKTVKLPVGNDVTLPAFSVAAIECAEE
jgi:alpha-L-arabinofuranosidase